MLQCFKTGLPPKPQSGRRTGVHLTQFSTESAGWPKNWYCKVKAYKNCANCLGHPVYLSVKCDLFQTFLQVPDLSLISWFLQVFRVFRTSSHHCVLCRKIRFGARSPSAAAATVDSRATRGRRTAARSGATLTLIVVGRLAFPGGGEGGGVSRVLAVDRVAVRVAAAGVALNAHVM